MYRYTEEQAIEILQKAAHIEYSDEQLAILKCKGGMRIIACAGSGKTSILTHLISKRILTGEIGSTSKLLCTTYSKSGSLEMEERLNKLMRSVGITDKVSIKTLHSFYLMIMKKFGYDINVIDNSTRMRFIREACKECGAELEDEDFQILDSLISYQVNNLLSDEKLVQSYVYTLENLSQEKYTKIRKMYASKKNENSLIDFDDMQLYVYTLLKDENNKQIIDYCRTIYTDYYIDEAQDVSKIQFEILKRLITNPNKLVFIGDDDQCIYEWRGADPSIILNICGYYDIENFVLSTNYRCLSEIVNPASIGIQNNVQRSDKTMKPFKNGGRVKFCNIDESSTDSMYNISKYVYAYVKKLVKEDGVDPSSIGLIARNNQQLAVLSNMLFKDGIYCISSNEMKFTKSRIYTDIKGICELAQNVCNPDNTQSTLWKVCPYLGARGSKIIADVQRSVGLCTRDAIGMLLSMSESNVSLNDIKCKVEIPQLIKSRLSQMGNSLKIQVVEGLEYVFKAMQISDPSKRVTALLSCYECSSAFMYCGKDKLRIMKGYVEYTNELVNSLGISRTKQMFRVTEQYENGSMAIPCSKVTMTTAHGAKGKEWEYVGIIADDNKSFPSFYGISNLIDRGIDIRDISNNINEERRLHYVASTRAKKELVYFANISDMSVFALESFEVFKTNDKTNNISIISMAKKGCLYDCLQEDAVKKLTSDKYKIDIDISSINLKDNVIVPESNNSLNLEDLI